MRTSGHAGRRTTFVRVLAGSTILFIAACGTDGSGADGVTGAWARPTPPAAVDGVLYLTITSATDDELVGVEVPGSVAQGAELHETVSTGGGAHSHGGSDPESLSMGEVDGIDLPAGRPVEFAPGGNHIMLVDLVAPLERGDSFEVDLRLASGRTLTATAEVADNPIG